MVAKECNKSKGSPKAELGEIDTSAPFQSVKDAVSLFSEGAFSGERQCFIKKARPQSADRVLAKETELYLAHKELNQLKQQLENAETIKAQALAEPERAKKTVEDLTEKLKHVNESKKLTIEAAEVAKHQAKQFSESDNSTLANGSSNVDSLRSIVEALKVELEDIKREHSLLRVKESETESTSGNLHVKLRKAKSELEEALAEEAKVRGASDEMIATIHQLLLESENAKREAEGMKQQAEELKREAKATRIELEEAEKKLQVAITEAEEAKAAEAHALDQIKMLSEKTDAARVSTSDPRSQITISRDEFESLSRKVELSEELADMRVEAVMAQVEAVQASETESLKRLEAAQKELKGMKAVTREALKKAEMAETAKKAVEGELRRWREREHKRAAEAASRILAESEESMESSPHNYQIQKLKPLEKPVEMRKLEKAKMAVSKKALFPSLTGFFHKKKNQVGGGSPSFLTSEESFW